MATDGTDWIGRLNDVSTVDDLDGALTRLLFLPITAFFVQAANAVEAISRIIVDPAQAFGSGVQALVTAMLGGSADVLSAGADASASDVGLFGIAGQPVSLVIVFASAYILAAYLSAEPTSDLIPFTFTNIPFIGNEEDEE